MKQPVGIYVYQVRDSDPFWAHISLYAFVHYLDEDKWVEMGKMTGDQDIEALAALMETTPMTFLWPDRWGNQMGYGPVGPTFEKVKELAHSRVGAAS